MKETSTNGVQPQKHRKSLFPIFLFYIFAIGFLFLSGFYLFYIFTLELSLSILLYLLFLIPTTFIIYRLISGPPSYYNGWKKMDFQHYFKILFIMYLAFLVLLELEMKVTNYGIYVYFASLLGMLIYTIIFLFFADGFIKIKNHVYFYQTDVKDFKKLKDILDKKNLDYIFKERSDGIFSDSDKVNVSIPSRNLRINFSSKGVTLITHNMKKDVKNLMGLIQKC